jgi:hypothetical protein
VGSADVGPRRAGSVAKRGRLALGASGKTFAVVDAPPDANENATPVGVLVLATSAMP